MDYVHFPSVKQPYFACKKSLHSISSYGCLYQNVYCRVTKTNINECRYIRIQYHVGGRPLNPPPPPTISKTVVSNTPYHACAFQRD